MSSLRELKRRIAAISGTHQLTQAMRMVSVSKYNRALALHRAYEPYKAQCDRLLQALGGASLSEARPLRRVLYVLITGNRGLCGVYNQELLRHLRRELARQEAPWKLIICGKWGQENAADLPFTPYTLPDIPDSRQSAELARLLLEAYRSGEADEVYFVYQEFHNVLVQEPVCRRLLPMRAPAEEADTGESFLYVPDRETLREAIARRVLCGQVYAWLLSAATGMHGATMTTMRAAADNSGAMLEELTLHMNQLRQNAITTQVLEVSGAALQEEQA